MGWSEPIPLRAHRATHTATLLGDGTVLVAGGGRHERKASAACDPGDVGSIASCEIVDPLQGASVAAPPLAQAREGHGAARLADGSVLVIGGMLELG